MSCIKAKFNVNEVIESLGRLTDILVQAVVEAFQLACLEITAEARQLDTYTDQTNNLRSSIGFGVYLDGHLVAENYQNSGSGSAGTGDEGQQKAKEDVESIARQYSEGIVGVIVAGEYYALYVESKGYDVLTGPANKAQEILDKYIGIVVEELKVAL